MKYRQLEEAFADGQQTRKWVVAGAMTTALGDRAEISVSFLALSTWRANGLLLAHRTTSLDRVRLQGIYNNTGLLPSESRITCISGVTLAFDRLLASL